MEQFSAARAVEAAEALVRPTRAAVPAPPRRSGPKPPPAPVTLQNRPLSSALPAPRWTFLTLAALAPLWLRVAFCILVCVGALGAFIGALTVIGLAMMAHQLFSH